MSDPANLLNLATELAGHAQNLRETGNKLEEMAKTLRSEAAKWADDKARAAEQAAQLAAQVAQAARAFSVDVNVGVRAGHGLPHPRTSVNARVDYPGSNPGHGESRAVSVIGSGTSSSSVAEG
jgi:hypothetical protein